MNPVPLWGVVLAGLLAPHAAPANAAASDASIVAANQTNGIRAEQPWARATAPRQSVGGVYVTLTSPANDVLLGASSPVARLGEVHEMRMDGTVMQMRTLADGLPLPAGQPVALTPGGYHIMLMDLKQPLKAGQTIPVQLRFRDAPPLDVMVRVAPVGARGPDMEGHGAMPGHAH